MWVGFFVVVIIVYGVQYLILLSYLLFCLYVCYVCRDD